MRRILTLACLVSILQLGHLVHAGPHTCYDCKAIPYPRDCDRVVDCVQDSKCYIEEYITVSGTVLFNTGCRSEARCGYSRREVIVDENDVIKVTDELNDDVTLCEMCCDGDYCNSHGCNSKALPPLGSRGPVCFNCHQHATEDSCYSVRVCDATESCLLRSYVTGNGDLLYTSECISSVICAKFFDVDLAALGRRDLQECSGCCNSDYCNRNCSSIHPNTGSTVTTTSSTTARQSTYPLVSSANYSATHSSPTPVLTSSTTTTSASSPTTTHIVTSSPPPSTSSVTSSSKTASTKQSTTTLIVTSSTALPTKSPCVFLKPTKTKSNQVCKDKGYTYDTLDAVCYKIFHDTRKNWYDARRRCQQDGGDLIVFRSSTEERHFDQFVRHLQGDIDYWVGASDEVHEGRWTWVDGSLVDTHTFFHHNQPNNFNGNEDCAALNTPAYMWSPITLLNDEDCHKSLNFICEVIMQTNFSATNSPTTAVLTSSTSSSTTQSSTTPAVTSTTIPTRPPDQMCRDKGYTYDNPDSVCYKIFHDEHHSWHGARRRCQQDGGDLIVFRSSAEEDHFVQFVSKLQGQINYWVGASDEDREGHFTWIDGSQVDHKYFQPGQPDNYGGNEDCAALNRPTFYNHPDVTMLNDERCADFTSFICEIIAPKTNTHQATSTPCRNGDYTYNPDTGICFKINRQPLSQHDARLHCQRENADLLILRNGAVESVFINMHFNDQDSMHRYWLGAERIPHQYNHGAADFRWINGRELDNTLRWYPGEPNNFQHRENCLSFTYYPQTAGFSLNDDACPDKYYFICEVSGTVGKSHLFLPVNTSE